jgi:ssDNA-binding Zn-finger/Zn-ribbon topoisomerase 1
LFTIIPDIDINQKWQFCVGLAVPKSQKLPIVFSVKMASNKRTKYNNLIEPPQIPGLTYYHLLFKGEIAAFRSSITKEESNIINYGMKQILGFSDMYFDKCINYPDCSFNEEKLKTIKNVYSSSRVSAYNYNLKDEEKKQMISMNNNQPMMIVKCNEGQFKQNSLEYCIFETNIFTNKDRITLKETETFSNFILKGENNYYHINFPEKLNTSMNLDVMVFSGEVSVHIEEKKIPGYNSFLSNKITYEFNINEKMNSFIFNIHAEKNSFYIVKYQLKRGNAYLNALESRVNFVESLTTEIGDYRIITLKNNKKDIGSQFLSSFYSKNCRYNISQLLPNRTFRYIDTFDDFAHLSIEKKSPSYVDSYMFLLRAIDTEIATYQKKSCLLFISGFELENEKITKQRAISLSEGVSHYFVFSDDFPKISYNFYISNNTNPLYIDFNLIDKTGFEVTIFFGHQKLESFKIYRNQQKFLNSSILQKMCKEDKQVCIVQVDIKLEQKLQKNKVLETTISHVNAAPMYLERNVVKQDIIIGNYRKYYYMAIDKDEVGEITVDYKRSSGHIYAAIVPKNVEKQINDSEWRGIYKFPKSRNESLTYEAYFKKININKEDTKNCDKGCYLLITIQSSNLRNGTEKKNESFKLVPYRITINPRIYPYEIENYNYIPKVRIPVNEFIIGNIAPSDKEIYEFYQVLLPFDSELVIVDWQADKPSLYIRVGNLRPTTENYDFLIEKGHDTILRISKEVIFEVLRRRNMTLPEDNSLKRLSLVFGVYTNIVDTLYSSVYAFKLFQPPNYVEGNNSVVFELLHIRSDQKVQCVPKESGGVLGCAFAVVFDGSDIDSHLIVYPRAQDDTVDVQFIGDLVEAEAIERNNISKVINEYMMGMKGQYMSSGDVNYIYIDKIDKSKSLLLIVTLNRGSIIEVLSSTYTYDYQITPNPSTPQIFALNENKMQYSFDTTQDLLINIECVSGKGYFYWNEEKPVKYYLSGRGDRVTLTSATKVKEHKLANLVAKSNNKKKDEKNNPGFIYFITYYPRNPEYNVDQVSVGRSTEFNYRDTKFPLNFYTQIGLNDISVSFNFYKLFSKDNITLIETDKPMFTIWGLVITEEEAYYARYDKSYKPLKDRAIKGHFDGAFGILYISSEDIKKYNIKDEEKRYLFFSVEINDNIQYEFYGASVEIFITEDDPYTPIRYCPENVYINGKLGKRNYMTYKLKTNFDKPFLNLDISINNPSYSFSLHTNESMILDSIIGNYSVYNYTNGRRIMSFPFTYEFLINNTVYISIYNVQGEPDEKLSNFIFKYVNEEEPYDIKSNILKNDTVQLQKDNDSYTITFNKINHTDVVYYIKGTYENSFNDEELIDSMAISERNGLYKQLNNPVSDEEGKIKVKLDRKNRITFIKVLAKITHEARKLYLLYNPVLSEKEPITRIYTPTSEIISIKYNGRKHFVSCKFQSSTEKEYRQRYRLFFKSDLPYYLKVETISETLPNQIIYFSQDDPDGITNRLQLAQEGSSLSNVMWIKREQIYNSDNSLYIPIQCQNRKEGKCNYEIRFSGHNLIDIDNTTFVYSYYVTNGNRIMEFRIQNNYFNYSNLDDLIMTFYSTGAQKIDLFLYRMNNWTQYNFKSGSAITINMTKNNSFILIVEANVGDYISVGSKVSSKSGKLISSLKTNNKQITGILKKNKLNK